ncbi:MAG: hypothetical protein ACRBCJ_11010 [Hyphomicrobiaceae bacterium]
MTPTHVNPVQWQQALGYARQSCAHVFRDGGTPEDALRAFGLTMPKDEDHSDWSGVVEHIADAICANPAPIDKAA